MEKPKRLYELFDNTRHPNADATSYAFYTLIYSVWLLEKASWQGELESKITFSTFEEAKETKDIIQYFLGCQCRKGKLVSMGNEEEDFWKLMELEDFKLFYSVGDIKKTTVEIVG